jgi:hypothetical protein
MKAEGRVPWTSPRVQALEHPPVLACLARLQAGTSDTPIHDQLVVQLAVRQLAVNLKPAMEAFRRVLEQTTRNVAAWAERHQGLLAQLRTPSPEEVLDRIRADQASLEWH